MYRTHRCGEIGEQHIGQDLMLAGWVDVIRDHGGVLFADLRDETGVTQVVVHDEDLLKGVGRESVISVSGEVTRRDESTVNPKIRTGKVELKADAPRCWAPAPNLLLRSRPAQGTAQFSGPAQSRPPRKHRAALQGHRACAA